MVTMVTPPNRLIIPFYFPLDFLGCAKVNLKQLREEGAGPWIKRVLLEDVAKGEVEIRLSLVKQYQRH